MKSGWLATISLSCGLFAQDAKPAPEIFAPGVISTHTDESAGSFSPDGQTFYFVERANYTTTPPLSLICVSRFVNGKWTQPMVVTFSGVYLDSSPRVAPDGKRLFFASRRPIPPSTKPGRWKIFVVDITASGWGEPKPLPAPVASDSNDTNPTVTTDGTLYFASDRGGQPGYLHIYRSNPKNGEYQTAEKLGPEINGGEADITPYISPDGSVLLFASYNRPDIVKAGGADYPRPDLYVSFWREGKWTHAKHLGRGINTFAAETNPFLSPDGKWLYFTSERSIFNIPQPQPLTTHKWRAAYSSLENGLGNIYRIPLEVVEELKRP